jgi:hypothetical protein
MSKIFIFLTWIVLTLLFPFAHVANATESNGMVIPSVKFLKMPMPIPKEATAFCTELVRRLADLDADLCKSAQLQVAPGNLTSVRGVPFFMRDVAAADHLQAAARRRVLVLGGIHGDELSATAFAFRWIREALAAPGANDWRFVPLLNPDGMLIPQPTRVNAHGVDLNRNFPTPDWVREAPVYWQQRTKRDPRRYPGPAAMSEPETRFVLQQMESFKPHLIVSIHAPYGILDFDGPFVPPERLGRLYLDQLGIYPGSLGNFGGVHNNMPVVTIELKEAFKTPSLQETQQMWEDLQKWMNQRVPLRSVITVETDDHPPASAAE